MVLIVFLCALHPAPVTAATTTTPSPIKESTPVDPSGRVVMHIASDAPANATFRWVQISGPRVRLNDAATANPWFVPIRSGVYLFDVYAESDTKTGFPKRVRVIVTGTNRPPVAVLPVSIRCHTGSELILDARESHDPDGESNGAPLTFDWTVPDTIRINKRVGGLLYITPTIPGNFSVKLVVRDTAGAQSDPVECVIDVRPDKSRPIVHVAPDERVHIPFIPRGDGVSNAPVVVSQPGKTYRIGEIAVLDGTGTRSVDGDALTVRWEQLSGPVTIKKFDVSGPHDEIWRFNIPQPGLYAFRLTAKTAKTASAGKVVYIRGIDAEQNQPVADAGPDRTVFRNSLVHLDGRKSLVPSGSRYFWTQLTGPSAPEVIQGDSPEDEARPGFIFRTLGVYRFQLIVVVPDGTASRPDTVTVTVIEENRPPMCSVDAVSYCEIGETLSLTARAADPDHDPVTVQWVMLDGPPSAKRGMILSKGTTLAFTPTAPGYYRIRCVVNDPYRAAGAAIAGIYVPERSQDELPAYVITGQSSLEPGASTVFTATTTPSNDDDATPYFYEWRILKGGVMISGPAYGHRVVVQAKNNDAPLNDDNTGILQLRLSDGLTDGDWVRFRITISPTKNKTACTSRLPPGTETDRIVQLDGVETTIRRNGPDLIADRAVQVAIVRPVEFSADQGTRSGGSIPPVMIQKVRLMPDQSAMPDDEIVIRYTIPPTR